MADSVLFANSMCAQPPINSRFLITSIFPQYIKVNCPAVTAWKHTACKV